jgi:hypothetical protein
MTPNDDEVLARLRAALQAVAGRTPISGGRLEEVWAAPAQKRSRPVVTIVSAAAAVAAMAAVTAVLVGDHTAGSRSVLPASEGGAAASESAAVQSPTPTITVAPSPVLSPTPTITVAPSPATAADCVPENYYVIASPSEVAGLTYLLPATPAGYVLYGAWGTISRNQCANSVTWYVEYDPVSGAPGDGTNAIQLAVSPVGGGQSPGYPHPTPAGATHVVINGHDGAVLQTDSTGSYATDEWVDGGADLRLSAPIVAGDLGSLIALSNSFVLVAPDDPRIVAPADCQVPAGSTCPSLSATPSPSPSPTDSATATAAPSANAPTPYPTATPSPSR